MLLHLRDEGAMLFSFTEVFTCIFPCSFEVSLEIRGLLSCDKFLMEPKTFFYTVGHAGNTVKKHCAVYPNVTY